MIEDDKPYGKDLAKYKLIRAREEVDTAQLLFENIKFEAANNRAYYSIYYAITAVLCLEPVAFKKHKDTLGYFNKNYVIQVSFPKKLEEMSQRLLRLGMLVTMMNFILLVGKKPIGKLI